ncbi:hypothetical protein BOSEA31B_14165 [Hyphomicrobiales bacterium]|nr:hypothetical protein BOSEA31B_14165 [Hyphomicrobiales bacterium]CAH1699942.1 hypothetical protein BOSEA1005_12995 [Hyphomicrobiales bacterium]CAI0343701.1 hypothetical protein BO1005MUT1_290037 [Hyphomicrobiales bacterium]
MLNVYAERCNYNCGKRRKRESQYRS